MATENGKEMAEAYWKANLKLIIILLSIWALVSYVCAILLAPVLNGISIGYIPVGFWFAQQGSMYTFIILIFVYSFMMDKVDQQYDVHE
jgi:putative solute:sodium symporter small subunit